jgi:hypothetical protein
MNPGHKVFCSRRVDSDSGQHSVLPCHFTEERG